MTSRPQNTLPQKSTDVLEVFYDGACPLCSREIQILRTKARQKNISAILWHDISLETFQPHRYNKTQEEFMRSLHVRQSGKFFTAMDGIRCLYNYLKLGKWMSWTALPLIKPCCDLGYKVFARLRPRLARSSCSSKNC